ncbi:MAG: hypothetical protein EAX96_05260 [Candidatus Lokiarchaeota archaeon]|nr:hypothetical protein [Candidatus Lokiarchaeota archaeon]
MKSVNWKTLPIKNTILQILVRNKGVISDQELYSYLLKEFKEMTPSDFSKNLMALEIQGIINVSRITNTKNKIELLMPIGE